MTGEQDDAAECRAVAVYELYGFECPHCHGDMLIKMHVNIGDRVQCVTCGTVFQIEGTIAPKRLSKRQVVICERLD